MLRKSTTPPADQVDITEEDSDGSLSSKPEASAASLPPTDPVLKNLILELKGMVTNIDRNIDVLSNSVDSIKRQISEELTQRITTNENNIEVHAERLDTIEAAVRDLRNEAEATTKVNDLLIKGVPMLSNDNPINIFCQIATAIGYPPEAIPHAEIFRLGKRSVAASTDPPILVKFVSLRERNTFYRNYFRHRALNLSEIGFASNVRIYITENLTGHNLEIYKAALKLRHEKQLYSVSTSHGTVMIRFNEGEKPVEAKTISALRNRSQQQAT